MAQPAIGVLDNCPQVDTCSTNQEAPHANGEMDTVNTNGQIFDHSTKDDQGKSENDESCEDPKIDVISNDNPSVSILDEFSSQKSGPPPPKTIPEISDQVEEKIDESCKNNVVPSEGNLQCDITTTVPDNEEATNSKSIEAISLVDIKAAILNDQEMVSGDANDLKPEDHSTVSMLETESLGENRLQNLIDKEISSNSGCDNVSLNQQSSEEPIDIQVSKIDSDNSRTVFSKYAIQPGELTNQLIEGPSITLPPCQVPTRLSSSSSCDPSSDKEKSNGITTSEIDRNENSGAPDSSETNSAKENATVPTPVTQTITTTTTPPSTSMSVSVSNGSTTSVSADRDNGTSKSTTTTSSVVPAKKVKKTPHDFIFGKVLGEGSYSTVYLAKEVSSQREFAVKVCEKKHLIREHKTHFVMREKEVLMRLDHAFFIRLAYTFQDLDRLYYVLTYARNGELLSYLNKLSAFDVPCTRFYTAEVVVALEYLQSLGVIHRDLKPENILLGDDMHIKITDFGTSKIVIGASTETESENKGQQPKRRNSFVGTAEYVSPEVLNGVPANYGTDLWALGCIVFQCLSSSLPFRSGNEYQTFQKILKLDYEFPEGFNEEAKDLVQKLLVIESSERLGMKQPGGMQELKQHPFYQGIDWEGLPTTTPPKLLPYLPATASNPEFWGGQDQRTGFDDQRLAEIITGQSERSQSPELEPVSIKEKNGLEDSEWREKMDKQRQENQFHPFVENNLILRQGFVDKRKGLFARKRMLLLTEGPHLYYVDAHNKVLKGEIPWSKELRSEAKNFKIFFVHTPNRTYYLESRNPDAHHWVKCIQGVWDKYYSKAEDS